MKTIEDLCKEVEARTIARVEAESPSITDTPQRRLTVCSAELAALAAECHISLTDAECDDIAGSIVFNRPRVLDTPEIPSENLSEEPAKQSKTPKSSEN